MNKKRYNQRKVVKCYIKVFFIAPDTEVVRVVRQKEPDGVIRTIYNAALNACVTDVLIPFHLKHISAKYH